MKNTRYIIFRNDDLCALSDPSKEKEILKIFEKYNIPQVVSVTPNVTEDPHDSQRNHYHYLDENPEIVTLLKEYQAKGLIEIAQHGFTHQTNDKHPSRRLEISGDDYYDGIDRKWIRYSPANPEGYSEFNGLQKEKQREKIVKGKRYLSELFQTEIKTFIFPWDRLNEESLEVLEEEGFEYVLCSEHSIFSGGLKLMRYCLRDKEIFHLPGLISEIKTQKNSAVLQVTYHSWMFGKNDMEQLEQMLDELVSSNEVVSLTPKKLSQFVPNAAKLFKLSARAINQAKVVNPFLGTKIEVPRFYLIDLLYYQKIFLKAYVGSILLKHLGLDRALLLTGLCLFSFIMFELFVLQFHWALPELFIFIILMTLFAGILFLNLKNFVHKRINPIG